MIKNRFGLSLVVSAVIMIALVMAGISIIWITVNKIINKNVGESEACFGSTGKVTINNDYTCYNSSSGEAQVSINVGDIEIDGLLISIYEKGHSKSFKITKKDSHFSPYGYVKNYSRGNLIKLPEKNAGATYIIDLKSLGISEPSLINIAPIINKHQCGISDSLPKIDSCSSLFN